MGDAMIRVPVPDGGWMELPASDPRAQAYQRKTQPTIYIVRPKDSLYTIAQRELGDANLWPNIAALNNIRNPNLILAGQSLVMPVGQKPIKPPANGANGKPVGAASGSGPGVGKAALSSTPPPITPEMTAAARTPASLALGYGHLFVFFEQLPEIGASTKIIRKVATVPRNYALVPKVDWVVPIPGVGPLIPARPNGTATPVEHVMNLNKSQSPFLSASDRVMGSPSIEGTPLVIDVAKVNGAGGRIITVEELTAQLRDFGIQNPARRIQTDNLSWTISKVEGEVLINKTVPSGAATRASAVHGKYIQSGENALAVL